MDEEQERTKKENSETPVSEESTSEVVEEISEPVASENNNEVQEPVTVKTEPAPEVEPTPEPELVIEANSDEKPIAEPEPETKTERREEPVQEEKHASQLPKRTNSALRHLLDQALDAVQFRNRERMDKILTFAKEEGSVTNDQVEKLLRVSDSTAGRYLGSLARKGKLNRVGSGNSIRYEP